MFKRHLTRLSIGIVATAWLPAGVALAQEQVATCDSCHQRQHSELSESVHKSITCRECHGGENEYTATAGLIEQSIRSATGGPAPPFEHGADFRGKPTRSQVPERCGVCHADVRRMNPYGLRTDQLARYWTSGHGITLKEKDDDRVAVCIDCHGAHDVHHSAELTSRTHPFNVPGMCASCHENEALMGEFDLPTEVVEEYRRSVHGRLLFEQQDTGAPTCATCHGNHSATPPGFATVGTVCGQCHQHASENFATSIHAQLEEHKGCVQCHGGGDDRHFHLIERITNQAGLMIQRYAHLLTADEFPTDAEIAEAIHPNPRQIIADALTTCTECHEDIEDDESLPKLFELLDAIGEAEQNYVETGQRLEKMAQGVLLVDRQRFLFQDAKTHLIELAPLQHTLSNEKVAAKVEELNRVCEQVNAELDGLASDLNWRRKVLSPIWLFAVFFAIVLYAKYKQLKRQYVKPLPPGVNKWQP